MHAVWKAEIIKGSPAKSGRPKPWVARLTGLDDRYGFAREFVNGERDYSRGKEHHTRGVYLYFFLPPGLYEVFRPVSWRKSERYFIRVDEQGEWHKMSRDEVITCLSS